LRPIMLSIISSYIFYFIVIKIKEVQDKQNINQAVIMLIDSFINIYTNAKNDIAQNDPLSTTAPLYLGYYNRQADWYEYLLYVQKRLGSYLHQLIQLMPFLESRMVKEIINLQDNQYFHEKVTKGAANPVPIEFYLFTFKNLEAKIMKLSKK